MAIDPAMLKIEDTTFELRFARFEEQRNDLALEFTHLVCDRLSTRLVAFTSDGFVEWIKTNPQQLKKLLGTNFNITRAKLLYYNSERDFRADMEARLNEVFESDQIIVHQGRMSESVRFFDLTIGGRRR